nr:hypothetical protein [Deltaproteobacteria bacterium]
MRSLVWVLLAAAAAAACTRVPPPNCPAAVAATPAEVAIAAAVPKPPELDDPAVISQSRAFLDAFDRADTATFEAMQGPTFVR